MRRTHGFTIVELLIVIVVIAILATLSVVAYNGIRLRSQASAVSQAFKSAEKSLLLYKEARGMGSWAIDNDASYWTGSANPQLASIANSQPLFKELLPTAPVVEGIGSTNVIAFDNDADTYGGCSAASGGVNLYIANATNTELMQAVDSMMDDGNLSCGRVRYTGTSFHYNIARTVNG